ncbi:alpha/beta fold hydrolase [Streptomyces sp. BI20]|uniref:alpha/beta fold hydrolase n=1 Tax=Streptomyces sp. BI20 TaxID=3403460 RepID=UPI003C76B67A
MVEAEVAVRAGYARTVRTGSGGPGLLLAHGGGGSVEANYGPVLEELAREFSVVAVDYPGTGGTPRSERPLALDELADELVAAADAEGLETFAVHGYSLGGNVALRLAARYPERVTALVLSASFVRADARLDAIAELWRVFARRGEWAALSRLLTPLVLGEPTLGRLSAAELAAVQEATAGSFPPGAGDHAALVRGADLRSEAAGVRVPTLVIVTTEDELAQPALQRELAAAVPGAKVAELATGHLPFATAPARWAALIADFLRTAV